MTRRQELENYIIGSCLCNRDFIRETLVISPDIILDPLSRRIFELLPKLKSDTPLDDIIAEREAYGYELTAHACRLAGEYDFCWKKLRHNIEAKTNYLFGLQGKKYTNVKFSDYVSQFLKYTYATKSNTTTGPAA